MANFKPLKNYLLFLIDKLIEKHDLKYPFLDIGCGNGEVPLHLAQKEWAGKAIDLSAKGIALTQKKLSKFSKIEVKKQGFSGEYTKYESIFLCDVLEHIQDDQKFMSRLVKCLSRRGFLVVATTVFQKEWRWDDAYYGHVRRYEINELRDLLEKNGLEIMEMWDFTYPFFWLLRRAYTSILPSKLIMESQEKLTIASASRSAWDYGVFTDYFPRLFWWKPIFYLQYLLRDKIKGCECLILARNIN